MLIFSITPQVFAEYEDTIVVLETDSGRLIMEFFPDVAPNHVENFVTLAEDGFYTGTIFHRIIEGFMIQGGDPKTASPEYSMSEWGTGDPGYKIDAEFNNIEHKRGIVSMARSADPNSAGSQFFIVHKDSNFLDGQYTVFGRILTDESFDTLDRIATMNTSPDDKPIDAWKVLVKDVQVLNRSELSDLPDYVIPETNDEPALMAPTTSQPNSFPQFGISFTSPAGWLVQTPDSTSSSTPDIVVVGPKTSNSNPAVSITIQRNSQSLETAVENLRQQVEPLIQNGALSIVTEYGTQIDEKNAYVLNAIGHFEDREGIEQKIGFSSILVKSDYDMLYTLQYSDNMETFENDLDTFSDLINTIEFSDIEFAKVPVGGESEEDSYSGTLQTQEEGGGCLIATAAYGSEMSPQVQFLREIRDNQLMNTESGVSFMTGFNQVYYSFSPYVADMQRENPIFKEVVKIGITPLLSSLSVMEYAESESQVLGYGIGVILMNIGMYFAAPAMLFFGIRKLRRVRF